MHRFPWSLLVFAALAAYPFIPGLDDYLYDLPLVDQTVRFGSKLSSLFIFAMLGLALNIVLGNAGQLHLGIAAFFGIGAFTTGILRVGIYPFQFGFWPTMLITIGVSTAIGLILSSPTLRLRGDYLALVTLGFGVITITLLRKFDEITGGKQTLSPLPPPALPEFVEVWLANWFGIGEAKNAWDRDYRLFYFLCLFFLGGTYWLLNNLERSRLGRAWLAIREDELAATCMGINSARLKLLAFTLSAGIAGLAGGLYATKLGTTSEPTSYDFQLSVTILCAVILGGLSNRMGVVLGVFFIQGFEYVFSPIVDHHLQGLPNFNPEGKNYLKFSNWKLMVFGLALILMMRFRPHGIFPERRTSGKQKNARSTNVATKDPAGQR
jgi:branched-chain amino acid transport system permease protein